MVQPVGYQKLQQGRFRSGGRDDDGIFHRIIFFKRFHDLRHGRALLADCDINAIQLGAFIIAIINGFLVQNRVNGDGCFAGLAVCTPVRAGHARPE